MLVLLAVSVLLYGLPRTCRAEPPWLANASQTLGQARAAANDCTPTADVLVRVLCAGQLRVGLRTFYPGFSVRDAAGSFAGFEVDVARRIADFLGVQLVPIAVDAKSRIPLVAVGDVDLVIATMGHDLRRDAEVRFIRPHYYESKTVVVGSRDERVADWDDLVGRTVCLPSGNSSNILFIRRHIRILTFDRPEQLLDALAFHDCAFVVHDNTFFAGVLSQPRWAARFAVKFGFAPMPWGMAVTRDDTGGRFATLLDSLSAAFHADGTFLTLARTHDLDDAYLQEAQRRWSSPNCTVAGGLAPGCLIPPVDTSDAADASPIADMVTRFEQAVAAWFDWRLDLSLLKHQSTIGLLSEGVLYSLALVTGAMVTTVVFALGFAWLMGRGPKLIRGSVGALTALGQTSPLPLLMFFAYVVAGALTTYSGLIALVSAVLVLGFYNGANAGRAINEALQAAPERSFLHAVSASGIQLLAFLINATKGSPAAGMIGVPEFLNVMTDLTAYSRDRVMIYLTLLAFYTSLVLLVIVGLTRLEKRLARRVRAR